MNSWARKVAYLQHSRSTIGNTLRVKIGTKRRYAKLCDGTMSVCEVYDKTKSVVRLIYLSKSYDSNMVSR